MLKTLERINKILTSRIFQLICLVLIYMICAIPALEFTSDSNLYLIIAENVALYGKIIDQNGVEIVYWPPLYPIIISLGYPNLEFWVLVLHGLALIISSSLWTSIFRQLLGKQEAVIASWLYTLSTPLIMIHIFVWSEAIFFLLLTICIRSIILYNKKGQTISLVFISFSGFLMLLQRNAGVFFMPGMLLGLFLLLRNEKNWGVKYLIQM